jgi:predicted phosphodiesterase
VPLCIHCRERDALPERKACRTCKGRRESRRGGADPLADLAIDVDEPAPTTLRTIAILADVHGRERDRLACAAVLAWLRAHRIDVLILGGDFVEMASVAEHGGHADESEYLADIEDGNALLDEVREAVGRDSRIVYLEGNHETRLARYVEHNAAPLVGAVSLPVALRLAERGITWVTEREQPWAIGNLRVMHGHQDLARPPLYHAAKVANLRGKQGTVTVYGHTHRAQTISRIGEENAAAVGLGCLRALGPGWEHGRASGWEHGFGVAYVDERTGRADVYPVAVRHGTIVWDGRLYGPAAA